MSLLEHGSYLSQHCLEKTTSSEELLELQRAWYEIPSDNGVCNRNQSEVIYASFDDKDDASRGEGTGSRFFALDELCHLSLSSEVYTLRRERALTYHKAFWHVFNL